MKAVYLVLAVVICIFLASGCVGDKSAGQALPDTGAVSGAKSTNVSLPSSIENNCIGFVIAEPETIKKAGAAWERPHPGPFAWGFIEKIKGTYDFSGTDRAVNDAQENNVAILATVWPYADWDQKASCKVSAEDIFYPQFGDDGIPAYRCKPSDTASYKKFLLALVERYDGDGVSDMPGLKLPIKYWEVLNEPEMASPQLTFFVGTEQDYMEVLKESYLDIKQACPDCKVLHGGAAGSQPEFLAFWENMFKLGAGDYFDIGNIHYISSGDTATLNVAPFKMLMNNYNIQKPVWVTEAEFKDPGADVKASVQGALSSGAEKVFFVSFKVGGHGPAQPGSYADVYTEVVRLCPNK